jgi:formylglycine-generating enzyme required for sulfatase activity
VLSDFGIAKTLESVDGFTKTGMLVGSQFYASPEQLHDTSSVDAHTDIFSLGIVLYEMITGYIPSNNNFKEPLKDPQEYVPELPKELYGILSKALAENPKKRYRNMEEFTLALEYLLSANGETKNTKIAFRGVGLISLVSIILLIFMGVIISDSVKTFLTDLWPDSPTTEVTPTASSPTKIPLEAENLPTEIPLPLGKAMQLIPLDEFKMGSNEINDERPVHTVILYPFYIDEYEVTNAQYKACMYAGVCQPPKDFSSHTRSRYFYNSEFEDYPVLYVDWNMAKTYCEWRGARLPTEAEWEKAARGTDGRTYPWGETLDCEHANYGQDISADCVGDTTPVGNYESGQSVYGLYDMAGNVNEWVADWYRYDYYKTLGNGFFNPKGPERGDVRVLRGGSWSFSTGDVRSANRNGFDQVTADDSIGFRCAKDPK